MKLQVVVVDLEVSPQVKRWAIRLGIAGAVLGGATVAYAGNLITWTSGQTLQAADLNANFATVEADIATAQTAAMAAQTAVTTTQTQVTAQQASLMTLQTQVAAITPEALTGQVTVGGNPVILWQEFATPQILQFAFSSPNALQSNQAVPMAPPGARYILADVFATAPNDQQNFLLGRGVTSSTQTWVNGPGTQPSTNFGNLAKQSVILNYPGQSDGYGSYYGIWFPSQAIPINANGTVDFATTGNSGSSGWIYMVIKSYSL
jgi:hypothetical protein